MNKKKVNLFILGAPKCGTTSLYTYLNNHPEIFMSPIKEPHYFNTDSGERGVTNKTEYEKLYAQSLENHKYRGEASTWYLYSDKAVINILKYNPNARFIVMLRNPCEMAPSLHKQLQLNRRETITDFREAWNLQDQRRKGLRIPKECRDNRLLLYGEVCKLGEQLERLYRRVDKDRIKVVLLDHLRKNPEKEMKSIETFLGIKEWLPADFPVVNPATKRRSSIVQYFLMQSLKLKESLGLSFSFGVGEGLDRMNTKRASLNVDIKMRSELLAYFKEDICKIEKMLDINLEKWKL